MFKFQRKSQTFILCYQFALIPVVVYMQNIWSLHSILRIRALALMCTYYYPASFFSKCCACLKKYCFLIYNFRKSMPQDTARLVVTQSDSHVKSIGEEKNNRPLFFNDFIGSNEMDKSDTGLQNPREPPPQWGSRGSYLMNTTDDPNSSLPPYLPPVLEEPSSSFSEGDKLEPGSLVLSLINCSLLRLWFAAAEDDPLPGIRDLQINGQAFPGQTLQACGYSINGTTSCNFEVHFRILSVIFHVFSYIFSSMLVAQIFLS